MSNGIYDILSKLNGLTPKDNPVSMSAEPIYESVDPRGDIISAVTQLEEKYSNFKQAPVGEAKRKSGKNKNDNEEPVAIAAADKINYQDILDPRAKEVVRKARVATPGAKNDLEAIVAHIAKQDDDMVRVKQREEALHDELMQQQKINAEQEKRFRELDDRYKSGVVGDQEAAAEREKIQKDVDTQRQTAAATAKTEKGKKAANVYNFPKKTKSVATPTITPTAQPTVAQRPEVEPTSTSAELNNQPEPNVGAGLQIASPGLNPNFPVDTTAVAANTDPLSQYFGRTNTKKVANMKETQLEEMDTGVSSNTGIQNAQKIANFLSAHQKYREALENPQSGYTPQQPPVSVVLQFTSPDGRQNVVNLSKSTVDKLINSLKRPGTTNQERSDFTNIILADADKLREYMNNLNAPRPVRKVVPVNKGQDIPDMDQDKFSGNKKLPQGSQEPQVQESLGKTTMIKLNSILEAVRSVEDKKLREAAKPDFLDLDKDGDTDEPMKKAAKDAKDHEPAKPDSDAVAKRKRLQALKDKQEDERAEKGDYDSKSSSRVVKGRAYGGAAQKDDEDKDLDESGLQAYLGKKKYGKEGMKALQQAGRDGASKEKMAMLRAKHDKMDEVAPPGAKAERMVKHIKKGYSKDGNLSKREKGIAYATAWKARNKGQVEEGTNFGDTIKNSEGKMTKVKVTEGKDAIRNHPIYTTKEAWDHYSQELAEQESMEQAVLEPVVDVQQELDEIAKLAGLPARTETLDPMVPADSVSPLTHTSEGMGCTMEELQEAMSRKDYRTMANKIKNMDDRDLAGEMCQTFAEMAKADNPRFKEDMFFAACDVKSPVSALVDEETMDEGNEFTKARLDAIAQGKDTFSVSGKTYNVSGDTSDEKTQVESVNEDININVTANGEEDVINLIRKLSGLEAIKTVTDKISTMSGEACGACGSSPCGCDESVEEERDIELANTPHEKVAPINAVTTDAGGGLGGPKKQYPLAANRGANPLEEQVEEKLWTAYETMINDVKA